MKTTLKHIALFLAFLMLITSCYSYKQVPMHTVRANVNPKLSYYLTDKSIEVGDNVMIVTENGEYKNVWIESFNDSTIFVSQLGRINQREINDDMYITSEVEKGKTMTYFQIEVSTINNFYVYQKDEKKTRTLIIATIGVGLLILIGVLVAKNPPMSLGNMLVI